MFSLLVSPAAGQEAPQIVWQPLLQVRQRLTFEGDPAVSLQAAVGQRARLGLHAERLGLAARVSFQEQRRWVTSRGSVTPDAFSPELAEGWARVTADLTSNVGLVTTVGRQPLQLHEGRVLGTDDFSNGGQYFDAVHVLARGRPMEIEYANARRFSDDEDPFGLGVNVLRVGAGLENPVTSWVADAVWLVDARQTVDTSSTLGGWLRVDTGRWRGRAEGYVQTSSRGAATLFAGSAGWVIGPNERLLVHLRYDALSGDGLGLVAWRPLLGDSHTFNGLLGRYASPSGEPGGLGDLQVVVESRPAPQLLARIEGHRFWSVVNGGGYGCEVDGHLAWRFSPFGKAVAGAGAYTDDAAFGTEGELYGYLELDVQY